MNVESKRSKEQVDQLTRRIDLSEGAYFTSIKKVEKLEAELAKQTDVMTKSFALFNNFNDQIREVVDRSSTSLRSELGAI